MESILSDYRIVFIQFPDVSCKVCFINCIFHNAKTKSDSCSYSSFLATMNKNTMWNEHSFEPEINSLRGNFLCQDQNETVKGEVRIGRLKNPTDPAGSLRCVSQVRAQEMESKLHAKNMTRRLRVCRQEWTEIMSQIACQNDSLRNNCKLSGYSGKRFKW